MFQLWLNLKLLLIKLMLLLLLLLLVDDFHISPALPSTSFSPSCCSMSATGVNKHKSDETKRPEKFC